MLTKERWAFKEPGPKPHRALKEITSNFHLSPQPYFPFENVSRPKTLAIKQKIRVKMTKAQFQWWFPATVETPRKMKIRVSLTLLHIFRKYLMVVWDLWEILAST